MNRRGTDYTKKLQVSASAEQVFSALTYGLNDWWGKISKSLFKAGGQFTIQFENGYWWTFKIIEFSPNNELIWKCIDGEPDFNKEWIGHVLHWQIEKKHSKTILRFHQAGLTPDIDCYEVCSSTWNMFIANRLKNYIETIIA